MTEITILIHNIRSTHNVGSLFRTAEGFGVKKIIISGYSPYPATENDSRLPHIVEKLTGQIHKTALGAEQMVPFEYYDDIRDWLSLNNAGERLPIVALEQDKRSVALREFNPPHKLALLLGEEVHGVENDLLNRCDYIVEIPMYGKKESFNVSVSAGIALYELSK